MQHVVHPALEDSLDRPVLKAKQVAFAALWGGLAHEQPLLATVGFLNSICRAHRLGTLSLVSIDGAFATSALPQLAGTKRTRCSRAEPTGSGLCGTRTGGLR